ncbi:hypothetical protein [Providencia stuartii]|uniref:hypothetical protein n=1 Tax=Providencia stuartii TaxID=588 RepID=UPI0026B61B23
MKFKANKTVLAMLFGLFFLHGCAANNSMFSPPLDGENIHFTATVPNELEALPISATYRSEICRKDAETPIGRRILSLGFIEKNIH